MGKHLQLLCNDGKLLLMLTIYGYDHGKVGCHSAVLYNEVVYTRIGQAHGIYQAASPVKYDRRVVAFSFTRAHRLRGNQSCPLPIHTGQ